MSRVTLDIVCYAMVSAVQITLTLSYSRNKLWCIHYAILYNCEPDLKHYRMSYYLEGREDNFTGVKSKLLVKDQHVILNRNLNISLLIVTGIL